MSAPRNRIGLLGLYGVLFFAFIYAPIILIVVFSFNANPVNMMIWSGFTLDWYRSIFGLSTGLDELSLYVQSTDQLLKAVRNSLVVALTTTSLPPSSAPR